MAVGDNRIGRNIAVKIEVTATPTQPGQQVSGEIELDADTIQALTTGESFNVEHKLTKLNGQITLTVNWPAAGDTVIDTLNTAALATTTAAREVEVTFVVDADTDKTFGGTGFVKRLGAAASNVDEFVPFQYVILKQGAWTLT